LSHTYPVGPEPTTPCKPPALLAFDFDDRVVIGCLLSEAVAFFPAFAFPDAFGGEGACGTGTGDTGLFW
jgi:hypothetical protein